ncbi:MAG TPA: M28 family peptidase [Phycisphaerales bacterium]|nr:M28 family peptidase [Phycisphaerales bacterium]
MLTTAMCVMLALGQPGDAPSPLVHEGVPREHDATIKGYFGRLDLRVAINDLITPEALRAWHMDLAKEPHIAGTEGSARVVEKLRAGFEGLGLKTEVWDFYPLLCEPIAAELEVIAPERLTLDLAEKPVRGDPDSAKIGFGWNAYSGSGEVTAGVVYANYGTKADFEKLAAMGVSVKGKIVLARYGGNYRGYKAKFAEAAGAAGLIIYTDPADSGYMKGLVYPEGGYANDCCIQRGSIVTLPWQGDPLTPGRPATEEAERLKESEVALPRIPVQPASYAAANEILSRMTGEAVPEGWQGGLPFTYRIEGGDELKVRLKVEQKRVVKKASNVIARIEGSTYPEQLVIVGCHHDAWNNGAADPLAGTIAMMECARAFAELEKKGERPLRTIVFAAWDAEEFGIIGSSEWVEAHRDELTKNGIAYINLDMASMGLDFGSAASPSLRRVIADAASSVPQPKQAGKTVLDAWRERTKTSDGIPPFGDLGGGSDHVAFLCHAGVPSCSMGGSGSKGNSYHSAYDTLPWYWKTVGTDYESARMVARVTAQTVERLAYQERLPLDFAPVANDVRAKAAVLKEKTIAASIYPPHTAGVAASFDVLHKAADQFEQAWSEFEKSNLPPHAANAHLMRLDRLWLTPEGLPDRPWFRNSYAAPDEDSGYSSWILPGINAAIARRSEQMLADELIRVKSTLEKAADVLRNGLGETPSSAGQ